MENTLPSPIPGSKLEAAICPSPGSLSAEVDWRRGAGCSTIQRSQDIPFGAHWETAVPRGERQGTNRRTQRVERHEVLFLGNILKCLPFSPSPFLTLPRNRGPRINYDLMRGLRS